MSPSPYNDALEEELDLQRFDFTKHRAVSMSMVQQGNQLILASMVPSTPGAKISLWHTQICGAWLNSINNTPPVQALPEVHNIFRILHEEHAITCVLLFAHPKIQHGLTDKGIPLLQQDRLTQLTINQLSDRWDTATNDKHAFQRDPTYKIVLDGNVLNVTTKVMKLTCGKLMNQQDWSEWIELEFLLLYQYNKQLMFGTPVVATDKLAIFHLVWPHVIKELDGCKKAHCVCIGSPRSGQVQILDHTYVNCVNCTGSCLFYAISAAKNMLIYGANASNAFAETQPPKQGFYIYPNRAFKDWWVLHKKNPPIPDGHVILVFGAMQGHPESPRFWEKHINKILRSIDFTPTVHEPCIYSGTILKKCVLFM
jgi:hypothetical protein